MPFYGDVQAELDSIGQREQSRAMAYAQTQKVTLDQINRANTIQRNYTWLPAGASYAFARAGLDDDTVHRIASSALQGQQDNTALGLNQPGDVVSADTEAKRSKKKGFFGRLAGYSGKDLISDTIGGDSPLKGAFAYHPAPRPTVVNDALKGATRTVTAAMDVPKQFAQGSYREFSYDVKEHGWQTALRKFATYQSVNQNTFLNQTDLGQTIKGVVKGDDVDQGSGFFVGTESGVAKKRQAAEAKYGQITYADGSLHNRSIGRDFASLFTEPGSRGYQVLSGVTDAAVATTADATTTGQVTASAKAAREFKAIQGIEYADDVGRARKIKDAIGLIYSPGRRATYSPQVMETWFGTRNGIKTAESFAQMDAYDILKATKGNMPGEMVGALADAKTPDQVRNLLRAGLGQGAEAVPTTTLGRYGVTARSYVPEEIKKYVNRLPSGSTINADDPTESLVQLERQLDYMETPTDLKRELVNKMAAIEHKPDNRMTWNLRKSVFIDGFDAAVDRKASKIFGKIDGLPDDFNLFSDKDLYQGTFLNDIGEVAPLTAKQRNQVLAAREKVKQVREIFNPLRRQTYEDDVIFNMTEEGTSLSIHDAVIDNRSGEVVLGNSPQPWLLNEFHGQFLPTPDWGAVHSEMAKISPLLDAGGDLRGTALMHEAQEKIWKPLVVLRPAGALRIIGETQAGMYAAGYKNIATHPLNFFSIMLGDSKLADKIGALNERGLLKTGVLGDELKDADGLSRILNKHSTYSSKFATKYLPGEMTRMRKGEAGYYDSLAHEIGIMRNNKSDPLPRMIAQALDEDVPLSRVKEQFWAMEDYRKELQAISPYRATDEFGNKLAEGAQQFEVLMDRRFADAYVDGVAQRMRLKTGMDPTLLSEIADPKMSHDELITHLRTNVDDRALPDLVKGPRPLTKIEDKARNRVLDWMFGKTIREPVHVWSESPATRQAYWGEAKSLAPLLNPEDAAVFVANAEKAGLAKGEIRQLKYFAERATANPLSIEQVDELAKNKAVKVIQTLFEDHVDKRRFTDALGLVSPFAHVWAETLTRWSKFLVNDPALIHNLEYGLHEAHDPTVADATVGKYMGVPEGRGFLYPDEKGQERFAYPLSAQAMKVFTGLMPGPSVEAPLTGSLQGLSLGFDVIPGVGPIASLPLAKAIPTTPEWDGVRDLVFPYGQPKSLTDLKEQAPAWMRRVMNWDDQRTQGSTTMQVMVYLASTGKYDLHNEDPAKAEAENKRLETDARKSATWFTVFRGIAGATAPSAPAPEWWLEDKTGTRIMLQSLSDDYRTMYDKDPQNAMLTFMEKYGDNAMLAVQGKSISVALGGGMPPTKEADQWARSKPGLADDLPLAYGFFAPRSDGKTDLDFSTFDRQFAKGERFSLTPEQFLQESNRRVATTIYYAYRNQLPANLTVKQSAFMRQVREDLASKYPGYSTKYGEEIVGVPAQASVGQTIKELEKAANDSRLADNPATDPLKQYLDVRNQINAQFKAAGVAEDSWLTTKRGAAAREFLWKVGSKIAAENTSFQPMWESVLYREFQSTFEADQGVTGG